MAGRSAKKTCKNNRKSIFNVFCLNILVSWDVTIQSHRNESASEEPNAPTSGHPEILIFNCCNSQLTTDPHDVPVSAFMVQCTGILTASSYP
jgi:hypothetical protein